MRRLVFPLLLVLFALAFAPVAQAQTTCTTSPCALQLSKPFTAAADHEPDTVAGDTTGYRLYVNGAVVQTKLVSALTNVVNGVGTVSFAHAGLPKGTHVLYIEAYGDGGATASTTLTVVVTPGKPKAPLNMRVIVP